MNARTAIAIALLFLATSAIPAQSAPGADGGEPAGSPGGQIDLDLARSRDEFRWGVGAFHEGRFADAIVAFTRALAFKPEIALSREWLGRSYFHSGLVDAALAEWERVVRESGAYLANRIETIRFRRGTAELVPPPVDYAVSTEFESGSGDLRLFRRPAAVAAATDGTIYVTSMATHEVLRVNTNGLILDRLQGGLAGMDLPFDLLLLDDGSIVVSEFGADRVSILSPSGNRLRSMGSSGLGDGEMLGPQYLAIDGGGSIYVSEWGGRRVSKFSFAGEFLLSFGGPGSDFPGFSGPTGVEWRDGDLWVADNTESGPVLHRFDESGNFLNTVPLPLDRETSVEDIESDSRGRFLLCAGGAVLLYDPANEAVLASIGSEGLLRATSAVEDANHRIAICDFDGESVVLMSPASALYSGLDVRINRVVGRDFPRVAAEVTVTDRFGRPVVGLDAGNFIVSENGIPIRDAEVLSAGNTVETLEAALIVDTQVGRTPGGREAAETAVRDTYNAMTTEDVLRLYATSEDPQRIIELPASEERFIDALRENTAGSDRLPPSPDVVFRLAANELANRDIRRNVLFVTPGALSDDAFVRHGIEEIADLFVNNGITFSIVMTQQQSPDQRLRYLVDETGGAVRFVYEPSGVTPLIESLRFSPTGKYWLTYRSAENTDFGRAYIPLSVEARLEIRSGRDEAGYFGPSQ